MPNLYALQTACTSANVTLSGRGDRACNEAIVQGWNDAATVLGIE